MDSQTILDCGNCADASTISRFCRGEELSTFLDDLLLFGPMTTLTWVEISRDALVENLRLLKAHAGVAVAPAIKGHAYGHDMVLVARVLQDAGADMLCITDIEEGIALRKAGVHLPILLLSYVLPTRVRELLEYQITPTLYSLEMARAYNDVLFRMNTKMDVHVELDTGTHRLGVLAHEARTVVPEIQRLERLTVVGLMTHFATSDDLENGKAAFYEEQRDQFLDLAKSLHPHLPALQHVHSACTAPGMYEQQTGMTMVRPGIGVYGLHASPSMKMWSKEHDAALLPVLTWKTRVVQVKTIEEGESVSYGQTYVASRTTRVATLPIGYYDGYDRGLSNQGTVLIGGKRAPVIGRVCMNHTMVDVTDISHVAVGDEVVLIGTQGEETLSAGELAGHIGTINYEVVTRIGRHIPRVLV